MGGKKYILIIVVLVCLTVSLMFFFSFISMDPGYQSQKKLATVTFYPRNSTSVTFTCEVVSDSKEMSEGLMHREELPKDEGMLFVYEYPRNVSYWMKNTLIPLDIIFLDGNKTVINVEEADVEMGVPDENLRIYRSASPAQWVAEVNQGLCNLYNIDTGTHVLIKYI